MDSITENIADKRQEESEEFKAKRIRKSALIIMLVVFVAIALGVILKNIIQPQDNPTARMACDALRVGGTISFGKYEQDNNLANGKEEIEWLVLDKEGAKVLVISKYALDVQPYNTENTDITWETCTLRKWLNDTFLNTAFSDEEKDLIPTVTVSTCMNAEYGTDSGNTTQDKVFVLDYFEKSKYLRFQTAKRCKATVYAKAQGAYTNDAGSGTAWWWLRSPGHTQSSAMGVIGVTGTGIVDSRSIDVDKTGLAVRPALWIDLNAL